MSKKYFVHIVAVDENNGIGFEDKLLYRIKKDLEQFKRLTLHSTVVAGTKTIETLPPLKGRNVVRLTRNPNIDNNDISVINNIKDLIPKHVNWRTEAGGPIFIIGGGEVYKETLNDISVIVLTRIHAKAEKVDTWYPDFLSVRKPTYCTESVRHKDPVSGLEYSFAIYGYDRGHLKHFLNYKHKRDRDEKFKTTKATVGSKD